MTARKLKPAAIEYMAWPYGNPVRLVKDRDLYLKMYKELIGKESQIGNECDGVTHQFDSDDGHTMFLIGVFTDSVSVLAHECSHAAFRILGRAGVRIETDNNEAHAYLMSDMMDVFMGVRR